MYKAVTGMIYLYTNKQDSGKRILQNDLYFNLFTSNERFTVYQEQIVISENNQPLTCKHDKVWLYSKISRE